MYFLIGFSAVAALISLTVRSLDPTIGRQTAIAASAAAAVTLIGSLSGVFEEISALAALGGIGSETVKHVMKAVGIAYITRIASCVCSDSGETTLAESAELAGRLALVMMTLPIVRRIAELLIELINETI